MTEIEKLLIKQLANNTSFRSRVLPYIEPEHFEHQGAQIILRVIKEYCDKYNTSTIPYEALQIESEKLASTEHHLKQIVETLGLINSSTPNVDLQWLYDKARTFVKERAVYLALVKAIDIFDKNKAKGVTALGNIPTLLEKAISTDFDHMLGHDYFNDAEAAFDAYSESVDKIPFNLDIFDKITRGGMARKTLNVVIAGCVHPDTKVRVRFRKHTPTQAF